MGAKCELVRLTEKGWTVECANAINVSFQLQSPAPGPRGCQLKFKLNQHERTRSHHPYFYQHALTHVSFCGASGEC